METLKHLEALLALEYKTAIAYRKMLKAWHRRTDIQISIGELEDKFSIRTPKLRLRYWRVRLYLLIGADIRKRYDKRVKRLDVALDRVIAKASEIGIKDLERVLENRSL